MMWSLAVIDKSGVVAHHDKQYPARGTELPRLARMEVGPHRLATGAELSTAIFVDLAYSDVARSARRVGAILAAPSNGWFGGFGVLHQRARCGRRSWAAFPSRHGGMAGRASGGQLTAPLRRAGAESS
jgi:hypothetical protein